MTFPETAPPIDLAAIQQLIFTDLDGSLLDHYSYSFAPASSALSDLALANIPVICSTSKTFAELQQIRAELANAHPMIIENGAACVIPQAYFSDQLLQQHSAKRQQNDYSYLCFAKPRAHWVDMLAALKAEFDGCWLSFTELGIDGIMQATGLSAEQAALANQREFSEPLLWQGDAVQQERLIARLQAQGAHVLQGGRFLHVSDACDKGKSMLALSALYQQYSSQPIENYALGDGYNDLPMLYEATHAALIRSPAHDLPKHQSQASIYITQQPGPQGWAEAVKHWQLI